MLNGTEKDYTSSWTIFTFTTTIWTTGIIDNSITTVTASTSPTSAGNVIILIST